jgi:hypothetical protein
MCSYDKKPVYEAKLKARANITYRAITIYEKYKGKETVDV